MPFVRRPRKSAGKLLSDFLLLFTDTSARRADETLQPQQEALQLLTGKLLEVQEEERRRLARELHDDFNQRLAALAIEVGVLEHNRDIPTLLVEKVRNIREELIRLSGELHGLSRQLHPSLLEDFGLVAAVRNECDCFAQRYGIEPDFSHSPTPKDLPRGLALCLFRIVQEGLRNAARHAQAEKVRVRLTATPEKLLLRVEDDGIGFDTSRVKGHTGLGLQSMKERIFLVEGNFSLRSAPGKGTIIEVEAPIHGGSVEF